MDLVALACGLARRLPSTETYGLASQIRRSAASIPANIAEGHGRDHLGDYLQHLSFANGSLKELETHLLIAARLDYLASKDLEPALKMAEEAGRMLSGLARSLKAKRSVSTRQAG